MWPIAIAHQSFGIMLSLLILACIPPLVSPMEFGIHSKFWADLQSQAQSFYPHCPRGWVVITDQNSFRDLTQISPIMTWDQVPKKSLPVETLCSLTVMDGMNPSRSIGILHRVKPFRNGLTMLLTDGSLPKRAWLQMTLKSNHAFFLAHLNGNESGSISLICPFVEDHATNIEIFWDLSFGFYGDLLKTMTDQCYHQFQGHHWPIIFREVPPVVYNETNSLDGVKGLEVDVVNLLKKHLKITTPLIRDNSTQIQLPNGPKLLSIVYAVS